VARATGASCWLRESQDIDAALGGGLAEPSISALVANRKSKDVTRIVSAGKPWPLRLSQRLWYRARATAADPGKHGTPNPAAQRRRGGCGSSPREDPLESR